MKYHTVVMFSSVVVLLFGRSRVRADDAAQFRDLFDGKDLSGWSSFLFTGLFSLIAAAILNVFMGSHALTFAICSAGILIFPAFTAYDTQMIKQAYSERMGSGQLQHLAIKGALDLYLDFVNLFRFLLYFFGEQE